MNADGVNGRGGLSSLLISTHWEKPVVPETGGMATLLVRVSAMQSLPGQRRSPLDVAFVLDRSGSMEGEKLGLMKEAVSTAIAMLRDEDRVALVTYDQAVDVVQPLTPATSRAKAGLRLALHGIDAGGTTNLSGGWLAGCDQLAKSMADDQIGARIRRSLLLTDGLANEGITEQSELIGHAGSLRKLGVSTTTLGVGLDFDEHLLSTMSEAGGGNFQFIQSAAQLPDFFQGELGELLAVVASRMTLSVTVPEGATAKLVNAFPVDRIENRLQIAAGDISSGVELNLVFELEIVPGERGTEHAISVSATWLDPALDQTAGFRAELPALTLVSREEADRTTANDEVREEAALQRADAAQREAMRLDREGRHIESRAHLRQHARLLSAAPQSARVVDSLSLVSQLAESDARYGFDSGVRKQVTFDALRRSHGKQSPATG